MVRNNAIAEQVLKESVISNNFIEEVELEKIKELNNHLIINKFETPLLEESLKLPNINPYAGIHTDASYVSSEEFNKSKLPPIPKRRPENEWRLLNVSNDNIDRVKNLINYTKNKEGGYVDNPKLIEQPTNTGIIPSTLKAHPEYAESFPKHVKDLTQDQISLIYYLDYMKPQKILDINNNRLAHAVFDMFIMSNPREVTNTIQQSIKDFGIDIKKDGDFGSKTRKALNQVSNERLEEFIDILKENRMRYLDGLENRANNPGWHTRTMSY